MEPLKIQKIATSYGKSLNLLHSFRILPLVWCQEHQRMKLRLPSKLWIFFKLSLVILHEIFLLFQAIRTWGNEDSSVLDRTYICFNAWAYFLLHVNFYVVYKDPTVHPALVNNFHGTAKKFYGK